MEKPKVVRLPQPGRAARNAERAATAYELSHYDEARYALVRAYMDELNAAAQLGRGTASTVERSSQRPKQLDVHAIRIVPKGGR